MHSWHASTLRSVCVSHLHHSQSRIPPPPPPCPQGMVEGARVGGEGWEWEDQMAGASSSCSSDEVPKNDAIFVNVCLFVCHTFYQI